MRDPDDLGVVHNVRYADLTPSQKQSIQLRLEERRVIYNRLIRGAVFRPILIVGDRPGPAAPTDPDYHHTPFYSTKYCSGWLNALLEVNEIPESLLMWINAYDVDGNPFDPTVLSRIPKGSNVLLLGGNAAKWYENINRSWTFTSFLSVQNFPHPQYWKRFKSKEPYPLIRTLGTLT